MACIKSLDQGTIHRICSGQVIINLANAVKELIENSLDAGSKTVEIRLKNYGSDSIEVIDDGPGISESDFQTITLKHYTSKIQQYDDLESLETFGFRGEALSSLCALCNLTITTRHSTAISGTKLEYDKTGLIKSKTQVARSVGTTVVLEKLFHTLPVRHKEFTKNLKREFHKLMHVVQCYCLISEGVKLSCFNIIGDKTTKLMSTHSKNCLKDNIIEIFGLSNFTNMVKFEQSEPTDEILVEYKLKKATEPTSTQKSDDSNPDLDLTSNVSDMIAQENEPASNYSSQFKIEGFVSNCSHNFGRSAPDRQYIYVNKRPCDHSKITKLMNEVFHQFNRNQYPMFVLNICLNSRDVDVNVTPDKLQMFIKNDMLLLAILKSSLLKMYNRSIKNLNINDSSFHSDKSAALMKSFLQTGASQKVNSQQKLAEMSDEEEEETEVVKRKSLAENKRPRAEENDDDNEDTSPIQSLESNKPKQAKLTLFMESPSRKKTSPPADLGLKVNNQNSNAFSKPAFVLHSVSEPSREAPDSPFSLKEKMSFFQNKIGSASNNPALNDSVSERIDLHMCNRGTGILDTPPLLQRTTPRVQENLKMLGLTQSQLDPDIVDMTVLDESVNSSRTSPKSFVKDVKEKEDVMKRKDIISSVTVSRSDQAWPLSETQKIPTQTQPISASLMENASKRKEKVLKFNLASLKQQHQEMCERNEADRAKKEEDEKKLIQNLKFKTRNIESKEAESELDRCITKEDFLKMKICGQFNKGFIVTQLDQELFIVDQHAADEIYNFETLQKTGKMEKQKLLQPRYLELPASAEAILIDNISVLEKTGYELQVCTNRKVGNRIMITCVPMSKQSNRLLNLKDIDEMLFVLSENELHPGSISTSSSEQSGLTEIKSSSLRAMYASKACRKSVMIGDSLNLGEMRRIVNHLNEIDKPWNCPHGRPTMRHLINIDLLRRKNTEL